ncbi:MAG TPA: hypothetical protein VG225_04275 [Terracidiphilus sp.]|jgi:hypothetical protein|nr:hypothetical protein [Terracidiphilus sp.]
MKRSGAEIRRIENALMNGNVVKIEPMHKPDVPTPPQARNSKSKMTREDRLKIAVRIAELSNGDLEPLDTEFHISLKMGAGPYSNAVTISKRENRVNFFILSRDLLRKAEAEGFKPEPVESTRPWPKDRFRFWQLGLSDIQTHEALFREIVKESVIAIMDRRSKKH